MATECLKLRGSNPSGGSLITSATTAFNCNHRDQSQSGDGINEHETRKSDWNASMRKHQQHFKQHFDHSY